MLNFLLFGDKMNNDDNKIIIGDDDNLKFGNCDVLELAKKFKTPLYIIDKNQIISNCKTYTEALSEYFGKNWQVLYASKAFSAKKIYKIIESENFGIDVVSGGELYTALAANFDREKIYFHGNNKSEEELRFAIESKIERIVIDNFDELLLIEKLSKELKKNVQVSIRLNPGIDAHTHDFIKTGVIDSKFGVLIQNGNALQMVKRILKNKELILLGIHAHIGSQIFDVEPYLSLAEIMINFIKNVKNELNYEINEINLGGGFGVPYTTEDDDISYYEFIKLIAEKLKKLCKISNLQLPKIVLEPGRSIIANAGITIYRVGSIKNIPKIRKYVAIDGGMTDNPRYALYGAKYEISSVANVKSDKNSKVTLCGKCCESGDLVIKDGFLQKVEVGDYVAVFKTGAYNYSMASHYNKIPKPAVIMVDKGHASEIIKRETYEDLIKNEK